MPVYLLAPILVHAAPALDQPLVVEPPAETASIDCCAAAPPADGAAWQLGQRANPLAQSPAEARPMLLAGNEATPVPSHDPRSTFAAAPSAAQMSGDLAIDGLAENEDAGPVAMDDSYGFRDFRDQASSIPWRFGGAAAAIAVTGFANWNWGSSRFRFESEGWFGKKTASLGMDKLGHAYSTYVLAEFFSDGIDKRFSNGRHASYTGAILAMGLMTGIEVFDGFSKDHGFSHEDLVVDAAGALLSVARRSVPGLREKVDFRLLYVPSRSTWRSLSCFPAPHCDEEGEAVRTPITDYSGQRYLLAFKLSGFEQLSRTPLRFLEVHTGYYARGFTKEEEDRGDPLRRRLFVGVGLNVGELLFPGRPRGVRGAAKWALQYLQVPYTAVHSN